MKHNYLKQILLCLLLLAGTNAYAYDAEIDGIYYNFSDDEAEVTYQMKQGYDYINNYEGSVVIPCSVTWGGKTYNVTRIGDYAFSHPVQIHSFLYSVSIPDCVTSIGNLAFSGCNSLTSIIIPDGVTSIGYHAFEGCKMLASINIPKGLTTISSYTFSYCESLTSITIPDNVTTIEHRAFELCSSLTSVTIPGSVTNLDSYIFSGCSSLVSVKIPEGVTTIGKGMFDGCTSLTSIILPNSVKNIEAAGFSDCTSLRSITIPEGVTNIGQYAFQNCTSMTSITIPASVNSIDANAFYNCYFASDSLINNSSVSSYNNWGAVVLVGEERSDGLLISGSNVVRCRPWATSVVIPEGVTSIGVDAFRKCSELTSITIPSSLKSSSSNFDDCTKLKAIHISDLAAWCKISYGGTQQTPMERAHHLYLNGQEVKDLVIPPGVTKISDYAFYLCYGLTSVSLPNGLESIGKRVFQGCTNVTSVSVPASLSSIDKEAFLYIGATANQVSVNITDLAAWCDIDFNTSASNPLYYGSLLYLNGIEVKDLVIPYGVTNIKNYAFYNCTRLNSLTIPASVTNIGSSAFFGNGGLASIVVESGNSVYDSRNDCNAIIETATNTLVQGCNSTIIPSNVTSISDNAFRNCYELTSVTIPEGVTSIGNNAFYGCSLLNDAFTNHSSLTSNNNWGATLYNGEEVNGGLFVENDTVVGCRKSVTYADIPEYVTSIGAKAFYGCTALTSITIPSSVTSIGTQAFSGCTNLTSVRISDLAAWCNISFEDSPLFYAGHLYVNDEEVKNLVIPDGVTSIGDGTFAGCVGLTSVSIPASVTSIGNNAFYGCSGLTSISIPASVTSIGNYAFYDCRGLTDVWCYAENIPSTFFYTFGLFDEISGSLNSQAVASVTLHVPAGSLETYKEVEPWSWFGSIVPIADEDALEELEAREIVGTDCYNLAGQRIKSPQKGINIIGGRKVLMK